MQVKSRRNYMLTDIICMLIFQDKREKIKYLVKGGLLPLSNYFHTHTHKIRTANAKNMEVNNNKQEYYAVCSIKAVLRG